MAEKAFHRFGSTSQVGSTQALDGTKNMLVNHINNVVLWLSTAGLAFGVIGSVGLALLTRVFITINADGTQSWGPNGMPNDLWLKRNIRLRRIQRFAIPLSYSGVALGFLSQLVALWLPSFVK